MRHFLERKFPLDNDNESISIRATNEVVTIDLILALRSQNNVDCCDMTGRILMYAKIAVIVTESHK